MDEQQSGQRAGDARRRARELLQRTAPVLRDVNARIDQNELLRDRRDALVGKASDLVQKADDALRRTTAIEGTVVEPARQPEAAVSATPAGAARPATPPQAAAAAGARKSHWTRQRFARMASAAVTEAVRPHRPLLTRRVRVRLGIGALGTLLAFVLLRRRR